MMAHCWVGDFAVRHGDIEVDTNENAFAGEVEIGDGELVGDGHGYVCGARCVGLDGERVDKCDRESYR
jgi:hypothetical protein